MKVNGKISVRFEDDGMRIDLIDGDASVTFCQIRLSPEQVCRAFSRLAHCDTAEFDVRDLDNVGKKMETNTLTFPLKGGGLDRAGLARAQVTEHCPVGWKPTSGFNAQDSFFWDSETDPDDPILMARTTIRRWVAKAEDAK